MSQTYGHRTGAGLWPEGAPPPIQVAPPPPMAAAPQAVVLHDEPPERNPLKGVKWSLAFIGLLGFVFAITTYALPIGQASVIVAATGLLTQKEKVRVPFLLKMLAIFLLWAIVGYAFTAFPDAVYDSLVNISKIWIVALVAANALRTRAQIRFFHFFYLACFAFYPVRGALFNYYIYHETLFGRAIWNWVYSNPNDLAAFCILQLSLALALFYKERWGMLKIGAFLGTFVLPLVILLTKSRGAFIAFAAFVLLVIAGRKKRVQAIAAVVVTAGVVLMIAPKSSLDRLGGLSKLTGNDEEIREVDAEGSAFQRYTIWKVARAIIADNPVMGVGLGAYRYTHRRYAIRQEFDPTARGARDTHSTYLNVIAETGFVGFFLYFIAYGTTMMRLEIIRRRCKKDLPESAQALYVQELGVLAFFIAAIFGSVAHVSFLILQVTAVWAFGEVVTAELAAADAQKRALRGGGGYVPVARPLPASR